MGFKAKIDYTKKTKASRTFDSDHRRMGTRMRSFTLTVWIVQQVSRSDRRQHLRSFRWVGSSVDHEEHRIDDGGVKSHTQDSYFSGTKSTFTIEEKKKNRPCYWEISPTPQPTNDRGEKESDYGDDRSRWVPLTDWVNRSKFPLEWLQFRDYNPETEGRLLW